MPPDEPYRFRRATTPPVPPSDGRERLILVEHKVADLQDAFQNMGRDLHSLSQSVLVLATQKEDAEKAAAKDHAKLERWKTAGISLLGALALGLIVWIARIAFVVQAAKVMPPP